MSRGGGGRGSFAMRGGKQRIGGQEVAWDYDPDLEIDARPQDLFPVRAGLRPRPFHSPAHLRINPLFSPPPSHLSPEQNDITDTHTSRPAHPYTAHPPSNRTRARRRGAHARLPAADARRPFAHGGGRARSRWARAEEPARWGGSGVQSVRGHALVHGALQARGARAAALRHARVR